jgi:hypothetical protein
MYRPLGGDIIYAEELINLPTLKIPYAIFSSLSNQIQIPSPESISSILVKLLSLKRVRTIH